MKLSVIIPTHNRANLLKKTLLSLCKQTINKKEFEIIIINNGSTDNTEKIVDSFSNKLKNIRYFYDDTPGLHVGRHIGLKESKTAILVYADDDIEATSTWLEGILESFQDNDVVLVGGNNYPKYEIEQPKWLNELWNQNEFGRFLSFYSVVDFGNQIKIIDPDYVWGCNFSIRKSILLDFGGFHPDGMPNDLLYFRGDGESAVSSYIKNKGYKAIFNPKASVYHFISKERMTKEYIYNRSFAQGISDSYTAIRSSKKIAFFNLIFKKKDLYILYLKFFLKSLMIKELNIFNISTLGYIQGYIYHHCAVKEDQNLLKWVLKANYLEE